MRHIGVWLILKYDWFWILPNLAIVSFTQRRPKQKEFSTIHHRNTNWFQEISHFTIITKICGSLKLQHLQRLFPHILALKCNQQINSSSINVLKGFKRTCNIIFLELSSKASDLTNFTTTNFNNMTVVQLLQVALNEAFL